MKNSVILSGLFLATFAMAQDNLISIPVGLCAGILGDATCSQSTSSAGGLINVPLNACIAALGDAKCQQASTASGDQESLISVPINICIAVLGDVSCNQKTSAPGGLIDIPLNLCLAVLGDAECQQNAGGPGTTVVGSATGITSQVPTVIATVPTTGTSTQITAVVEPSTTGSAGNTVPAILSETTISAPKATGISETPAATSIVPSPEKPTTYIHEASTSINCAEKPGHTALGSASNPSSAVIPASAPTTLVLHPSGGAVAPTGAKPQSSSQPSSAIIPPYTGAAGHLKMSGMAAAIGLVAAMGFQF